MKPLILITIFSVLCGNAFSAPRDSVRVLIIYGSKPAKGHKEQYKWFGGKPGGHVALDLGHDRVLSFAPTKYHPICHIFARSKAKNFRSRFRYESVERFWQTFNYTGDHYLVDSLKRMVVTIPINARQRRTLDSLAAAYTRQTPYDYAVLGMRCASATYDILARADCFADPYKHHLWWHILLPRDLRYELQKEALRDHPGMDWRVYKRDGSRTRKWDRDKKV